MATVVAVLGAIGAALGLLLWKEAPAFAAHLAPKVVRRAAGRLPQCHAATREEEWLSELASMDGMYVGKLMFAVGCWVSTFELLTMPSIKAARAAEEAARAAEATVVEADGPLQEWELALLEGRNKYREGATVWIEGPDTGDRSRIHFDASVRTPSDRVVAMSTYGNGDLVIQTADGRRTISTKTTRWVGSGEGSLRFYRSAALPDDPGAVDETGVAGT